MKKIIYFGLFVLVISGMQACTTYDYYVAGLNKTNMSGYHSFAWMPMADNNSKGGGSMVADAKIKDAATNELVTKGLRLQQRNPDLLVSYSTMVGQGTRTYYYPNYGYDGFYPGFGYGFGGWGGWGGFGWGGWGRWGGYRPYYYAYGAPFAYGGYPSTEHYKEGTIIIDLIDTHTKKVVWRGFGVGEVHHNPEKDIEALPQVVTGVLDQLHVNPSVNSPVRRGPGPVRRQGYIPTSNSI